MGQLSKLVEALRNQRRDTYYLRRAAETMAEKYYDAMGLGSEDIVLGQMVGQREERSFEPWADIKSMPTTYGNSIDFVLQWRHLTDEVNSAPINVHMVTMIHRDKGASDIMIRLESQGDENFYPAADRGIHEAITKDILSQIQGFSS